VDEREASRGARTVADQAHDAHRAARAEQIVSVVDILTLTDRAAPGKLELNDLGVVGSVSPSRSQSTHTRATARPEPSS